MARLIPEFSFAEIAQQHGSHAEAVTYEALRSLPGDYTVLYSVAWLEKRSSGPPLAGEADFVVLHPDYGLAVLEVKGGALEVGGGSGTWFARLPNGQLETVMSPVSQAIRAKEYLRRKLTSLPGWGPLQVTMAHGIVLPDTTTKIPNLGPDAPPEIVLYRREMESLPQRISSLFCYWAGDEPPVPLGADNIQRVVVALAPTIKIEVSLGATILDHERRFAELTQQQYGLLRFISGRPRALIRGGAGTGKTVLAFEKARQLAEQGFDTLLVCYNRPLADELERRSSALNTPFHAWTFHRLCVEIVQEAGLDVPDMAAPHPREFYDITLPEMLVDALERMPGRRFDAIVVDEAQDFAPDWWPALELALQERENGVLYAFMDDHQNIYSRELELPAGMEQFPLDENLRNTQAIHEEALKHYPGDRFVSKGPAGQPVEYLLAETESALHREVSRTLHRLVNKQGVHAEDIVILSGCSAPKSIFGARTTVGAFLLEHSPIPTHGRVCHESVHRFKGLERPIVVLVEFSENVRAGLIYVALTRAKSHVVVVGSRAMLEQFKRNEPQSAPV